MITIECNKSSDPDMIGLYEFEFDKISIGRSTKNDLIILDPEIPISFLIISLRKENLVIKNQEEFPYYFINNKKVSGTIKLSKGDKISFGKNEFTILEAASTKAPFNFTMTYDNCIKENPELKFSLDTIEEILIELEKDTNV